MTSLRNRVHVLVARLLGLVRERQFDADSARELESHLQLHIDDNLRAGMSPDEARRDALVKLGGFEQAQQICRDQRGFLFLESLLHDLRFAVRTLRKSPGFTAVAVLTLALGIGANTAIFSVINGVLLRPLPYENPQEIVVMKDNESLPNVMDIQRQGRAFSLGGAINAQPIDYTNGPEPLQIHVGLVNSGFFEILGVPPMRGRIFSEAEDVRGGPRLAVVSYPFWQGYLGGDPNAVGRLIVLGGNSYAVIGVMPKTFVSPREHADVFISLWVADSGTAADRDVHSMHTYWRLKKGVPLKQAQADIAAIHNWLAEQFPDEEKARSMQLIPLRESVVGDVRPALLVLFGAVGLVLLIACANFASLLIARGFARRQEMLIRAALGAGHGRLIRKSLTESVLLSFSGGAAGLLFAQWGTRMLLALTPEELRWLNGIHMDSRVLLFVLAASVLTGIIFGMAPALLAARTDVAAALNEGGRSKTASASGHRIRKILVTTEVAFALVLLVGAGLLIKGFSRLRSVDPGFNPDGVLTMFLQLPETRYAEIPKQTQFRRELLARLNSLPGVQTGMITDIPLGGNYVGHSFVIDGRPPIPNGEEPNVQTLSVMGDYFRVMQIPLRAGRDFTAMDREGQPLVAVVNEELVRQFFPRDNPVGSRIHWARDIGPPHWMTVVGVVADVKHSGLNQPTDPAVYTTLLQSEERWKRRMNLAFRSDNSSSGLVEEVKAQVWSVDSQIPVSDVQTMAQRMAVSLAEQRFYMILLGAFAALALILAGVGIYGVVAYTASQSTHEIGIRMALGAQRRDVLRLIVAEGAKLTFVGTLIGIVGALALTRVMSSLLFEVKPGDPAIFAAVAILLALVAFAACYIPARRATQVDPMVALRY
jgi:putative ABC transport system permease protein